jgi:hypothetical protein
VKRAVTKALVTGFAAFTVLTSSPNFAPKKARATDTLLCKEYDQNKIMARYQSLSKNKKTDLKKLKYNTLLALECLAKKGYMKMSWQADKFLISLVDKADKNSIYSYLSAVKWLRQDKTTPKRIPSAITRYVIFLAEKNRGTHVASEALKVAYEFVGRFKINPDHYLFSKEKPSKLDLQYSRARMFMQFGSPEDGKKEVMKFVKLLKDDKTKEAAASLLYEYSQHSRFEKRLPKLDAALQSQVEAILTEKQKQMIRRESLFFLAHYSSEKVAISAINIIDKMMKTSKMDHTERYQIAFMLRDIAHFRSMTKVATKALTVLFSQRNLPLAYIISSDDVRLQRATTFLFFAAPEDAKKAVTELASFFNDRKLMKNVYFTFTPYSRTRREQAATAIYQYNLWIKNPEFRKLKFGKCKTCKVKLDPVVLKQAESILTKEEKANLAFTAQDLRMMEAIMAAQKYQTFYSTYRKNKRK